MPTTEYVILVNERDEETGLAEKMEAHRKGLLHRAFSIIIYNSQGHMLLHRRAEGKYHSPGLWTNACCSHPRAGESVMEGADRRLREEMGFSTPLKPVTTFIYKADVGEGLTEHEYDHLLVGHYDEPPEPNPSEVAEWGYMPVDEIREKLKNHPESFTEWFKVLFQKL